MNNKLLEPIITIINIIHYMNVYDIKKIGKTRIFIINCRFIINDFYYILNLLSFDYFKIYSNQSYGVLPYIISY